MPKKLNWRSRLLAALMLSAALLQGTVPLTNDRVRRLGDQLKCKCGCGASVATCNMINCHFSDPARTKLLQAVDRGESDQQIFDEMIAAYGKDIMLSPPSDGFYKLGWVMPFVGLGAGFGVVYLVFRHSLRKRKAEEATELSPELARYKERMERDLSDLE